MKPISLHIFTEEESARSLLLVLLPKILPAEIEFHIYPPQGKQDLEKRLPRTLPAISSISNARILIIEDQDSNDCIVLKAKLNQIVQAKCSVPYLIRIACKSMENWFLGDLKAVGIAYERFKMHKYANTADFRRVDKIVNSPEKLLRIVPELQNTSRLPKIEVAKRIGACLNIDANTSDSFNQTVFAIKKLTDLLPKA